MSVTDRTSAAHRRLLVFRHAKAAAHDMPDEERPLADRGRRDAPEAGRWLRKQAITPDRVVCSTARRARETWELAAAELAEPAPVEYDERVYYASVGGLIDLLHETSGDAKTVVLVGHNPVFEELVLALAGSAVAGARESVEGKFPTSAIAVLEIPCAWADLNPKTARLLEVVVPRG